MRVCSQNYSVSVGKCLLIAIVCTLHFIEAEVAVLLYILSTVVSATASQTTKKTPFRSQEDSCAGSTASDDVFTFEGAGVSPGPSSSTQSEETQNPLETGSPISTSTSSSFPYLKKSGLTPEQQEGLSIRLCVESEDIVHKFWHLHSRVYKSLCEQNVSVDKLVTHLLLLDAFDPVYKHSQKPVLQTFFQELQNAGSIEKVLCIIRDYISFFNYRVIEHIVDGLGTDQDRVELQNYKKEFDEYSKRRIYECPPVYGPMSGADHADLLLKLDSVYEKFTVKELKKFEYRLSRILHVSPQSVLRLCRVEEGCLQLIFQVPSFVQQEIFPLSSEQESALAAEGVIRLTCGEYNFPAKVCIYCVVTCHWCTTEVFSPTHRGLQELMQLSGQNIGSSGRRPWVQSSVTAFHFHLFELTPLNKCTHCSFHS